MKRAFQLISITSFLLSLLACQFSENKNHTQNPAIEKTDSCLSHPAHTYQVFVPVRGGENSQLPLLIAIDSHASGQNAVNHLKKAVTKYPAVLVASNLIQNNDPHYIQELGELIADVKKKYPIGKQVYFIGFSGGARMALGYAANHPANGVIACGAFANNQQLAAIKCPVTGIIGMDDFNFAEVARYILQPETTPANVHIELSQASHKWPSPKRLTDVFAWFRLSEKSALKQHLTDFVKAQKLRIDSLKTKGEFIQAACIGRNMASVEAFEKAGSFREDLNKLISQAAYREQLTQLNQSLQFEGQMRQYYSQALLKKDEPWWKKEITTLHENMLSEPNVMKRMAYKRLSGFIGIICYSYTRQLAEQKDVPNLEQILMVYRLAEPENTEMKRYYEELKKLKNQ